MDVINKMLLQEGSGDHNRDLVLNLLKEGRYHLLPSFFKLITKLIAKKEHGLLDFRILFRTFGRDIPNVRIIM